MNRYNYITATFFTLTLGLTLLISPAHALEPHKNIKGLFNTTRDVVIKCLECHKEKAAEVLQSTHWTWKRERTVNGRQLLYGKKDSLAGFAIDIASNPARCLGCHISSSPATGIIENGGEAEVDCLVCHDTTGSYIRGNTDKKLEQRDFETIAHNVGKPGPENCLTCHFADCGLAQSSGESFAQNKKHTPHSDVHMAAKTGALSCQACHVQSSGHSFSRTMTHGSVMRSGTEGCSSCHTGSPHLLDTLNRHTANISCRTCHIPAYAADTPALVSWNWILSGKISPVLQSISGRITVLQDSNGLTSSQMIMPSYLWDDGSDQIYSRGQRIQREELTYLQHPADKNATSKIAPFRVIYGTQLYDTKYRYLISPLLSSEGRELFTGPDWNTIASEGMKAIILPYSGQYSVTPTVSYRRINHGVAPAGDALDCTDCHGSKGRLNWQSLGYDRDPWTDNQDNRQESEELEENSITRKVKPLTPVKGMQILPTPIL